MVEMQTVSHPSQTGEDFYMTAITCQNFCTRKPDWFTHLKEIRKRSCVFQIKMSFFFFFSKGRKEIAQQLLVGFIATCFICIISGMKIHGCISRVTVGQVVISNSFAGEVTFVLHHLAIKFQHKSLHQELYLLLKKNVPKTKVSLAKRNQTETKITSPSF